jgi:hypothetical protein
LQDREEAAKNQEGENHPEGIEKDVARGAFPGGDERLVKLIHGPHDGGKHPPDNEPFGVVSLFPGAQGQKDQEGQHSVERDMEKAVGVELADSGDGSRIGQEENGKNIGGGKKNEKGVQGLPRRPFFIVLKVYFPLLDPICQPAPGSQYDKDRAITKNLTAHAFGNKVETVFPPNSKFIKNRSQA